MKSEETMCICTKCRGIFRDDDLHRTPLEYHGISMVEAYVSPCCHADWYYDEEEGN